jgi:hypothetical protein
VNEATVSVAALPSAHRDDPSQGTRNARDEVRLARAGPESRLTIAQTGRDYVNRAYTSNMPRPGTSAPMSHQKKGLGSPGRAITGEAYAAPREHSPIYACW